MRPRLKEGTGVAHDLPADKVANSGFEPDLCPDLSPFCATPGMNTAASGGGDLRGINPKIRECLS